MWAWLVCAGVSNMCTGIWTCGGTVCQQGVQILPMAVWSYGQSVRKARRTTAFGGGSVIMQGSIVLTGKMRLVINLTQERYQWKSCVSIVWDQAPSSGTKLHPPRWQHLPHRGFDPWVANTQGSCCTLLDAAVVPLLHSLHSCISKLC